MTDIENAKKLKTEENEYAKIMLDVEKFLKNTAKIVMEAASHGIRVPGVRIVMRTLEGQSILVGTFESATICGDTIPHALVKEIGVAAASVLVSKGASVYLASLGAAVSGGWVLLVVAAVGALLLLTYEMIVDFAWHWSLENSRQPVYSVPYLDNVGSVNKYNIDEMWGLSGGRRIVNQYKEPRRPRAINESRFNDYRHPADRTKMEALPNEFFVGRPATPYDFVDITGGIGKKWLVRLDNQKFR